MFFAESTALFASRNAISAGPASSGLSGQAQRPRRDAPVRSFLPGLGLGIPGQQDSAGSDAVLAGILAFELTGSRSGKAANAFFHCHRKREELNGREPRLERCRPRFQPSARPGMESHAHDTCSRPAESWSPLESSGAAGL